MTFRISSIWDAGVKRNCRFSIGHPLANQDNSMEIVIFIGAQASGKSSFYKFRFFDSHVRINLDMLRTRNRESLLIQACLNSRQSFVVDNTNFNRKQRSKYFELVEQASVKPSFVGFYFQSIGEDCLKRNRNRDRGVLPVVPDVAIRGTIGRMELPSFEEGFDELYFVKIRNGHFYVEEWKSEI